MCACMHVYVCVCVCLCVWRGLGEEQWHARHGSMPVILCLFLFIFTSHVLLPLLGLHHGTAVTTTQMEAPKCVACGVWCLSAVQLLST